MPFKLNDYVDVQNHHRCHAPENKYMKELDSRGMLLRIENVLVDAEQLVLRTFQCDIGWCLKCSNGGGAAKYKGSCCTDLQVDITEAEADRLRELGRAAKQKLQLGARDPLTRVIERLVRDEFTEETDKGDLIFKHLPASGRCALSWMTPQGALRCGINSLCMALEKPLTDYKPDPCYLFPLHYAQPVPGTFFVTLISGETYESIGADAYTAKLRCLSKPQPGSPPAYQFLKNEIAHCFGTKLYEAIDEAARPILEREWAAAGNGRHK